jgi:hypothetical protein
LGGRTSRPNEARTAPASESSIPASDARFEDGLRLVHAAQKRTAASMPVDERDRLIGFPPNPTRRGDYIDARARERKQPGARVFERCGGAVHSREPVRSTNRDARPYGVAGIDWIQALMSATPAAGMTWLSVGGI